MPATGRGGHGAHGTDGRKPVRRTSSPRSTQARSGVGPGRPRPATTSAIRKAAPPRGVQERRASRAVVRSVVLASVGVLLAVTLVPTLRSYLHQQGQIAALRQQVAAQRVDVAKLQKEQARWTDDAYVIQQARERLKFVKVGEMSYTVIDGKQPAKTVSGVAAVPAASSSHPWYGQLWDSVQVADAGPAALVPAARAPGAPTHAPMAPAAK